MTRVLVVEDEDSFSDAISYLLRKEGFEVAVCSTGPDALETFDRTGADLVLLDLMLPGLPGSEVCRSLREKSNVPVIMLTAKDSEIDKVVGLEARGFILGGAIAHQLSTGFVPIRKKGKLPGTVISQDYKLEYGEAIVEVHDDAITPGERVLLVDDLLATGGTAEAGVRLVERLGGVIVGCGFIIELPELGGRGLLEAKRHEVHALCAFAGS